MSVPVEKQFEILELIRKNTPIRQIANRTNISKTTIQDYKKRGIPFYRENYPNRSPDFHPVFWMDERKCLLKRIDGLTFQEKQYIDQKNKSDQKIRDLQKDNHQKDDTISTLKQQVEDDKKEKENYKNKYDEAEKEIKKLEDDFKQKQEKNTGTSNDLILILIYFVLCIIIPISLFFLQQSKLAAKSAQTKQTRDPLNFYFDKTRQLCFLCEKNGEEILSPGIIKTIHEINQKIINRTFTGPYFYALNPRPQSSITVAYGKYAVFKAPVSPDGCIQPNPISVILTDCHSKKPMFQ